VSEPLRVLVLCTGNSARSQMAEALLNRKGAGRVVAESAGSKPVTRVNPFAIASLKEIGIEWAGHTPKSVAEFMGEEFNVVITVCDNAKEACPIVPGSPAMLHWGMSDPAEVEGSDRDKALAFRRARDELAARIDELLEKQFATGLRG
jgi:arsenate reductase (thioredoxin)